MKFLKRYRWALIAGGAVLLVAGFLLFRPDTLFVDDVIDESLAEAFTTTAEAGKGPAGTPTTASADAVLEPDADDAEPEPDTVPAAPTTTVPQPSEPVTAATGSFFGIDHRAEGTATVYEQDGRYVLRFEDDTDIQNGPDLYVWLLESDQYEGGDPGAVIDLGRLKGNVGGQNYELPPEYAPDVHRYVLIWCERFSTPFAAAPLV
jgi:hypothetical protein